MNRLSFRIWAAITVTLGTSTIMLVWTRHIGYGPSLDGLIMLILLVLATLGIWVLTIYLILKPSSRIIRSLPFKGCVTIIATAGIIAGLIHYIRFIPSPFAVTTLSRVIATLLMTTGMSAYSLLMWIVWSGVKKR